MKCVKWKHSRLKSKLVEYRHHMFQNYAAGTVRKEMNCIIFFYKFYDIEVWDLPKVNDKSIQKPAPIYFKEMPDKEVIREAFQIASPLMKAIILFSCSSGCARTETLSWQSRIILRLCLNIFLTTEETSLMLLIILMTSMMWFRHLVF